MCREAPRRYLGLLEAIPVPSTYVIFLQVLTHELHCDRAPASVGIRLWVIAECVEVRQVIPDRTECLFFFSPALGKIGFTAGDLAYTFKDGSGNRFFLRFPRTDHVNDRSC